MDASGLYNKFYLVATKLFRVFWCKSYCNRHLKYLKNNDIPVQKLTYDEKKEVKKLWGGIGKFDYNTHVLVKSVTGVFDARILPDMLFRTKLELEWNRQSFKTAWADKSYFDMFFPELRFPKTLVRNISGQFLNENYEPISLKDALNIVEDMDAYIIKPSLDSGDGRGVELVKKNAHHQNIFNGFGSDFVVQEVFRQHPVMSMFNPTSVNIVRIVTLYWENEIKYLTAALRCGGDGEVCDNIVTKDGKGMVIIGIDGQGALKDKAVYVNGTCLSKLPNGVEFCGVKVPGFEKMVETAKKAHEKLPYFKFVGWDFVVDENSEITVMEYNIKGPGLLYYQYVNGPIFGDSTEEIIADIRPCLKNVNIPKQRVFFP